MKGGLLIMNLYKGYEMVIGLEVHGTARVLPPLQNSKHGVGIPTV